MSVADHPWPDAIDLTGVAAILAVTLGLPALGYLFAYLDVRAYLRSLRRALVLVRGYATALPDWVVRDTPPCLVALGLSHGCSREEVLAAYRLRVKELHPDAGGSRRDFARLQLHFEEALQLVEAARA